MAALMSLTVVVTAAGAPGTAALLHALRENGEREVEERFLRALAGNDLAVRIERQREPPLQVARDRLAQGWTHG